MENNKMPNKVDFTQEELEIICQSLVDTMGDEQLPDTELKVANVFAKVYTLMNSLQVGGAKATGPGVICFETGEDIPFVSSEMREMTTDEYVKAFRARSEAQRRAYYGE
jgi:hypothetical protein